MNLEQKIEELEMKINMLKGELMRSEENFERHRNIVTDTNRRNEFLVRTNEELKRRLSEICDIAIGIRK
jgi:hypothetical protein